MEEHKVMRNELSADSEFVTQVMGVPLAEYSSAVRTLLVACEAEGISSSELQERGAKLAEYVCQKALESTETGLDQAALTGAAAMNLMVTFAGQLDYMSFQMSLENE